MTLVVTHPYVSTITETTPSGGPGGTVGPTEWNANHTLTGVASPAQGGTGITSGTGVTFFSSATVLADSGTLPLNQVLLGGGANASPTSVSSLGSTLQVLYGGSPPQWGTAATTTGGGGGTPGGASGQIQYNNASNFGGFGFYNGSNTVEMVSSTSSSTPMAFQVYNSVDISSSPSNYERGVFDWTTTANVLTIGTQKGGTGTLRALQITGNPVNIVSPGGATYQWDSAATSASWITVGGVAKFSIFLGTPIQFSGAKDTSFGFTSDVTASGANDTTIFRDAATGVLALGNTNSPTTATAFRVYNTTDNIATGIAPTNYERGVFDWTTTANTLTIGVQVGGAGSQRSINFLTGTASNFFNFATANTNIFFIKDDGSTIHGQNTSIFGWSSTSNAGAALDTGLQRVVAKVVSFSDGGNNTNGWLQWAGQARVSSNVTSSSTTLANVTGLSVTLQASRTYSFESYLFFTDLATAGIQAAINTTTTSTGYTLTIDGFVIDGSGTFATRGFARATAMGTPVASTLTTGTLGQVVLRGTLTTSSAITANIQFSQIVPNATQTIINTGSYMWIHDMP